MALSTHATALPSDVEKAQESDSATTTQKENDFQYPPKSNAIIVMLAISLVVFITSLVSPPIQRNLHALLTTSRID